MASKKPRPKAAEPAPKKPNPGVPPLKDGQGTSEWPSEEKVTTRSHEDGKPPKREKSKKEKEGKFDRTYGQKFEEVLYDDIKMMIYRDVPQEQIDENPDVEKGRLDMMAAAELLGWSEEDEQLGRKFGKQYKFKDLEGHKIRLLNNPTNRPFRKGLALRYANEILRGVWALNGETIIIDEYGKVQSGQHRLAGVIFATQMLKADLEKWSDYGWLEGNVFIECLVVAGIKDKPEIIDTIDIGQKRTLGDVIFRNDEFAGDEKTMTKMSNTLSHAVRLVWLRVGGMKVSDAPFFPHSEALETLKEHPKIKEAVIAINEMDGVGKEGKRIQQFLSLGYAAGLMYLMGTSGTDVEGWREGAKDPDFKMWDKAKDFWMHFAKDAAEFPMGHPIKMLRKRLSELSAGDGAGRQEIVGTVIKAFNAWNDGKKPTDVRLKRVETEDTIEITEHPRLGGLDTEM